jgi:F-type H+-transporting ATPase subunit b
MFAGITALAVAAADVAHGATESSGGLPQLNPTDFTPQLIWLAITFVLLYVIMDKIALPRVGEVIEERRDRVQRDLDAAARLKNETDKALAAYEQALADARGNAHAIAKETRERLASEVDQERSRVEGQINAKLTEAETRIAATKDKALQSVGDIATETARAVVARLLGQDVSADEAKAAVSAERRS